MTFIYIGIFLMLFGIWFLAKKMNRSKEAYFLAFSGIIPLLLSIFVWKRDESHRYIYFIHSFWIILASVGFYGMAEMLLARIKKYKKIALFALILIFLTTINFKYLYSKDQEVFVRKPNSYYPDFNRVFSYVLENKKPGDVLVTRAYRSFYWKDSNIKVYDTKNLNFAKNCQEKIENIIKENPNGIIVYPKVDKITQCSAGLKYYEENLTRLKDPSIPSSVLIYRWDR